MKYYHELNILSTRFTMSICFLSLETSKIFNDLILNELEKKGFDNLTISLISIFPFIEEYKKSSISSLALKIGQSRQALHKSLKKLESYGYIDFELIDGRKEKSVVFTLKGKKLMNIANNFIDSIQKEILNELGEVELKNFIKSQQIIFDFLNNKGTI